MNDWLGESVLLPYGWRDGRLVSVHEVDRGLACRCLCPNCGGELVARKGMVRVHHFAHASGHDCGSGVETAIHMLAKDIVAAAPQIFVPGFTHRHRIPAGGVPIEGIASFAPISLPVYSATKEAAVFAGGHTFRADVLLEVEYERARCPLAVEICVSHPIDERKKAALSRHDIASVEIVIEDKGVLSGHPDEDMNRLRKHLLDRLHGKQWIHPIGYSDLARRAREDAEAKARLRPVGDRHAERISARRPRHVNRPHARPLPPPAPKRRKWYGDDAIVHTSEEYPGAFVVELVPGNDTAVSKMEALARRHEGVRLEGRAAWSFSDKCAAKVLRNLN